MKKLNNAISTSLRIGSSISSLSASLKKVKQEKDNLDLSNIPDDVLKAMLAKTSVLLAQMDQIESSLNDFDKEIDKLDGKKRKKGKNKSVA